MKSKCEQCGAVGVVSAIVGVRYYRAICQSCLSTLKLDSGYSSGAQSFDRRRQYEDYAQDTVQPYDAKGEPRSEFYRLYPKQAEKIFTKEEIEKVRRSL